MSLEFGYLLHHVGIILLKHEMNRKYSHSYNVSITSIDESWHKKLSTYFKNRNNLSSHLIHQSFDINSPI